MKPVQYVWVASSKESRLHLAERSRADTAADSIRGRCGHSVRKVIGAWSGRPPNIKGYGLCEPCCVLAEIVSTLPGPVVSCNEALSTALDGYRPGAHSSDRLTELIPRTGDVERTDQLPVFRPAPVANEWPAIDQDLDRGSGIGAPGSSYLPGTVTELTQLPRHSYRPRHALGVAAA